MSFYKKLCIRSFEMVSEGQGKFCSESFLLEFEDYTVFSKL